MGIWGQIGVTMGRGGGGGCYPSLEGWAAGKQRPAPLALLCDSFLMECRWVLSPDRGVPCGT